jgi:hemoglobin
MYSKSILNIRPLTDEEHVASLYEKLGGQAAVDAVVETFYRKVLSDDRISEFFDDVDMDRQAAKQKAFLTMVLGGPAAYTGKDMREGHRHLVQRGLNDSHVDAVIELLGKSLKEHGVSLADIETVASIANSVRNDVLNRGGRNVP